jgi:hypothetical protein
MIESSHEARIFLQSACLGLRKRWQKAIDCMLLKQEGNYNVDRLRTIVLFDPEANQNFKFLGRTVMAHAENHRQLDMEAEKRQTEILTNQVASQQVVIESQSGSLASAIVSSLKSAFSVGRNGPPTQTDIIGIQHYATSAAGVETSVSPLNRTTASHAAPDGAPASHVPAPAPNEAVEVGLHESNPSATNAAKRMIPEVAALLIANIEN